MIRFEVDVLAGLVLEVEAETPEEAEELAIAKAEALVPHEAVGFQLDPDQERPVRRIAAFVGDVRGEA